MYLQIDGHSIQAKPGQSLLDLVRILERDRISLKERPLAAKIAGEVFTLNYIPVREKDITGERPSIRRAMAASNGEVRLLHYGKEAGKEVYIRTAQFAIFLALRQLWPQAAAKVSCTLGSSVYIQVSGTASFSASALKERVQMLVYQRIPLHRRRVPLQQALDRYTREGQLDKARLLSWRTADYFDEYAHEDFADYYYGEMAPDTGSDGVGHFKRRWRIPLRLSR